MYLRWVLLAALDIVLAVANLFVAPVLSVFTRPRPDDGTPWGGWFGTWDNPPQGDARWQREGWFPHHLTGWRGYLNRVGWLYRNPCYGYQRWAGVGYGLTGGDLQIRGNPDINDRYAVPGWFFATQPHIHAHAGKPPIAFEFYAVIPWGFGKCLRVRLGWKITSSKFEALRFAPLVDTINPFKSYGR